MTVRSTKDGTKARLSLMIGFSGHDNRHVDKLKTEMADLMSGRRASPEPSELRNAYEYTLHTPSNC
jgi:hypothetical protein